MFENLRNIKNSFLCPKKFFQPKNLPPVMKAHWIDVTRIDGTPILAALLANQH